MTKTRETAPGGVRGRRGATRDSAALRHAKLALIAARERGEPDALARALRAHPAQADALGDFAMALTATSGYGDEPLTPDVQEIASRRARPRLHRCVRRGSLCDRGGGRSRPGAIAEGAAPGARCDDGRRRSRPRSGSRRAERAGGRAYPRGLRAAPPDGRAGRPPGRHRRPNRRRAWRAARARATPGRARRRPPTERPRISRAARLRRRRATEPEHDGGGEGALADGERPGPPNKRAGSRYIRLLPRHRRRDARHASGASLCPRI